MAGSRPVGMDWPGDPARLDTLQLELAERWERAPRWRPGLRLIGGAVFAAPERGIKGRGAPGDRAWAAAVVIDEGAVLATSIVPGSLSAAYQPGRLALRVGPLLEQAVRGLLTRPDVLLVNATGLDHPRRGGLAIHLGAVLDLPSVGVTDRMLTDAGPDAVRPVSVAPGLRPIMVHAGWRTDVETAVLVVSRLARGTRTPEPLRAARSLARGARARGGSVRAPAADG